MPPRRRRASRKKRSSNKEQSNTNQKRERPPRPVNDPSQPFILSAVILGGGIILWFIVTSMVDSHNATQIKRSKRSHGRETVTASVSAPKEPEKVVVAPTRPVKPVYAKTANGLLTLDKSSKERLIIAECSQCGKQTTKIKKFCPKCEAKLSWAAELKCPMCCPASMLEIEVTGSKVGYCYDCKGVGDDAGGSSTRSPMGVGGDDGNCPSCGGTTKCRWCNEGKIDDPEFILMKR